MPEPPSELCMCHLGDRHLLWGTHRGRDHCSPESAVKVVRLGEGPGALSNPLPWVFLQMTKCYGGVKSKASNRRSPDFSLPVHSLPEPAAQLTARNNLLHRAVAHSQLLVSARRLCKWGAAIRGLSELSSARNRGCLLFPSGFALCLLIPRVWASVCYQTPP